MARGTGEGTMEGKVGDWGGGSNVRVSFGTEWEEQVIDFTSATDGGFVLLQSGQFVGTIQIKYVKITHLETPAISIPVPMWEPDFATVEDKDNAIMGWGNNSTRKIVNDILELTNPSAANPWDAQAGKDFDKPLEVGTKYFLKVKIKGSVAGSISAGLQNPDGYKGCGDFSAIPLTTDWEEVVVSTTCIGSSSRRLHRIRPSTTTRERFVYDIPSFNTTLSSFHHAFDPTFHLVSKNLGFLLGSQRYGVCRFLIVET